MDDGSELRQTVFLDLCFKGALSCQQALDVMIRIACNSVSFMNIHYELVQVIDS